MTGEISTATYPNSELGTALLSEFEDCGENCTRAYYDTERDSADHEAVHAQRAISSVIDGDFREDLYQSYSSPSVRDKEVELALYEMRVIVENGGNPISVSHYSIGLSRLALNVVNQ